MIEVLKEHLLTNLELLSILGTFIILNNVLGAIMAATSDTFDKKRFINGIIKALLISLATIVYCCGLDVLPYVLEQVGITIPSDMATTLEIIGIILVTVTKYAKEVYDKLKVLLGYVEPEVKEEELG